MKKCCRFIHIGALEVYHNVQLKLLPKRSSYTLLQMIVGGMLTAIEVNSNLEGTEGKKYWEYSRSQQQYVAKKRLLKKNFGFRTEILAETMFNLENRLPTTAVLEKLKGDYIKRDIPNRMISAAKMPDLDPNTIAKSRFGQS